MIVMNVLYTVKPGRREAYYRLLNTLGIPQASRAEEGNLCYDYFYAADDPDLLFLWEQWQDEAALARHCQTPHFARLQEMKAEWLEKTDIHKLER